MASKFGIMMAGATKTIIDKTVQQMYEKVKAQIEAWNGTSAIPKLFWHVELDLMKGTIREDAAKTSVTMAGFVSPHQEGYGYLTELLGRDGWRWLGATTYQYDFFTDARFKELCDSIEKKQIQFVEMAVNKLENLVFEYGGLKYKLLWQYYCEAGVELPKSGYMPQESKPITRQGDYPTIIPEGLWWHRDSGEITVEFKQVKSLTFNEQVICPPDEKRFYRAIRELGWKYVMGGLYLPFTEVENRIFNEV